MAKQQISTTTMLWLFLLIISSIVTGALYFDMRHKNSLLEAKIAELENSQVLLMVPEEQAQTFAQWMAANPKVTQSIIGQAQPGSQVRIEMGLLGDARGSRSPIMTPQASDAADHLPIKSDRTAHSQTNELSESEDGVKVIALPHGGIRVTTRDDN